MARRSFWHDAAAAAEGQQPCDVVRTEPGGAQPQRRSIRRDPPPRPRATVPTDDLLLLRLAEELEYARRMLDVMGDQLAADAGVVVRHAAALQSVDIVGQMLSHIAKVIRSSDPEGAVELIGMCEMKARLTRKNVV